LGDLSFVKRIKDKKHRNRISAVGAEIIHPLTTGKKANTINLIALCPVGERSVERSRRSPVEPLPWSLLPSFCTRESVL